MMAMTFWIYRDILEISKFFSYFYMDIDSLMIFIFWIIDMNDHFCYSIRGFLWRRYDTHLASRRIGQERIRGLGYGFLIRAARAPAPGKGTLALLSL